MNYPSPPAARAAARLAVSTLILAASLSTTHAQQQTLVDWNHTWSWMHPMGALPPRPAGGADTDFTTTWYLKQSDFAVQYDGPIFGASPAVPGVAGTAASFDSGFGPGPVAYGDFQYTTTPLPAAPAEFTGVASLLTTPLSGGRYTGYFRTTFTVPNDGRSYQNPVLRYILDDGGFVYLDGVPVLRVNMTAGVADTYAQITEGKADTESAIRTAELYGPVNGPATGANNLTTPVIVGNAFVLTPVTSLAPGVHTLAISVHNESVTSSDIGLAVQLTADASDCVIAAAGTPAVRSLEGDAENLANDTVSFDVTVTGAGVLSPAGWIVSGPAGSSLIGQTGAYNTARHFTGVPVAEFPAPGGLILEVRDAASATCKATVSMQAPQRIGGVSAGAVSSLFMNKVPWIPVWAIDETLGTLTLKNAGVGADRILESLPVDLSGVTGDLRFSAELQVDDTSSGMEAADTFLAELILTDPTGTTTVNLVSRYDADGSGRMNGGTGFVEDEFNAAHAQDGVYVSNFPLTAIIPDRVTSVALVLHGVNDSPSESFTVKNIRLESAVHSIDVAPSGPVVMDNRGTADAADDVFSIPVSITPAALPAGSLGWTSTSTPSSGLYSAANPVVFGTFPVSSGAQNIILKDNPVTTVVSNTLTISPPGPPALTATLTAGSIVRVANGQGLADDTVTFEVAVTGAYGGPGYAVTAAGAAVQPATGAYSAAPVTFTLSSVPASGTISVTITDVSYASATATIDIAVPVVSVIGTTDFGAGASELLTAGTPAAEWVIDSTLRTLDMITGGTGDKIVESAVLDLSTIGAVAFSAKFRAHENSLTSNFENTDKFKAELIIDGATVVNLIERWDAGNGSFGSLGANGAPDGYLNGYKGEGATNPLVLADYNLYANRDEFNQRIETGETMIDNTFDLAYTIPAEATSVQLKIYGTGISGSEFFTVSDVLFTGITNDPDSDGDGIPDSVETAAGLNPASPADAALDLDSDGQSNLAEYKAGTSITDGTSNLRIMEFTRVSATSTTLRWKSVAGKSYRLQSSASLSGPWGNLGGLITGAPDTTPGPNFGTQSTPVTLQAPAARSFVRVVIP